MAVVRGKDGKCGFDAGKYVRYTDEQVQALERLYHECPKPNSFRRQQLLRECPILSNIEPRQIKVWFQNRRCREKQRKEATRLLALNEKLTAMNKVLVKQNDNLSKQAFQFVHQNKGLRRQLKQLKEQNMNLDGNKDALITTETSPDSRLMSGLRKRPVPQPPARDVNPAWLLAFAEETLSEFLAKATGTGIDWIQMPGMKPGPDSIGVVAVGHGCDGVAARACSLVGIESSRVADVLKDRPAWFRDCRRMEILGALTTSSGATVELLYTQMYSPTTLTQARDFCTLRYTSVLEDRNLVVCERSLSLGMVPPSEGFVRAEMLSSGYLIRPCGGVGSIVYIVDHMDLEAGRAPEVLRPMYESSAILAQKITIAALRHLRSLAQEAAGEVVTGGTLQPSALRELSLRIARSFNDAVNSFPEDGWCSVASDGMDDVSIALNSSWSPRTVGLKCTSSNRLWSAGGGGVLCAKASMLLQNVPPAVLVRFLREHRSEWADWIDCDLDASCSATLRTRVYGASVLAGAELGRRQVPMPLAHSVEHEEIMELVKFEGYDPARDGALVSKEMYLLQLCNGIDETAIGNSAQLIFAPVDGALSDDIPLLPSGFRVIPLDTGFMDGYGMSRTLDLASTLEVGSDLGMAITETGAASNNLRSIVTIAFQFGYENHNCDIVSIAARKYMRTVVASVQRVAMAIAPRVGSTLGLRNLSGTTEVLTLVKRIVESYRVSFGMDLLREQALSNDDLFKMLWHHSDAIICCTCKSLPEFIFANEAGLDMLETTSGALQELRWEQTLDEAERKNAYSEITKVMQQGFAYLPAGIRLSSLGRPVAYERAIAWNILYDNESMACVAFMFINWSF
uniref:Class III HD-Zip protein n=1 Tax=Ginkgo biloba TaxID=3311 RepID=A0A7M1ILE8_GINBI|nr:class III HD-Zip protein [Ginkgo biloba]|eukprot:Gb_10259 [translate_table: standard]